MYAFPTAFMNTLPDTKPVLSKPFPTYFMIVSRCCTYMDRCFCILLSGQLLESGSDPGYALTCPPEGLRLWPGAHLCLTVFKRRPLSSRASVYFGRFNVISSLGGCSFLALSLFK